jgi:tetratricopeptide (TPR) repeat protein
MRHNATLYDTLGLEQDATNNEIRAAFRKLALVHHPDRFSGNERDAAEKKFQGMTEAFNVLSRPESRDEYDKEISKGTDVKAMDPKEIARRLSAMGSQLMSEGNMAEALEHLKGAIDHDNTNARAHYFYGQIMGRIPGKEGEALRHIEQAVALEPGNATMIGEAASISLAAGMKARAIRLAEEALSLDPTNAKATAVLSRIESGNEQTGGLLDRFRNRS